MMRIRCLFLAVIFLFVMPFRVQGQDISLRESCAVSRECLRGEFREAQKSKKKTHELLQLIEDGLPGDPQQYSALTLAYYGATKGLEAKFSFNPSKKISSLSLALRLLDKAVIKDPDDLEVRFVRFATLSHLPPFFGVREKRFQDVNALYSSLIRKDYSKVDSETQSEMVEFLLKNGKLTKQQRSSLDNLWKELSEK